MEYAKLTRPVAVARANTHRQLTDMESVRSQPQDDDRSLKSCLLSLRNKVTITVRSNKEMKEIKAGKRHCIYVSSIVESFARWLFGSCCLL